MVLSFKCNRLWDVNADLKRKNSSDSVSLVLLHEPLCYLVEVQSSTKAGVNRTLGKIQKLCMIIFLLVQHETVAANIIDIIVMIDYIIEKEYW